MMKENFLANLSPDVKKRTAYIEGRPDLFETKIFRLTPPDDTDGPERNILAATRDPGSGNALMPVLKQLEKDRGVQIFAITDGRAQEILQRNFPVQDITPQTPLLILGINDVIKAPDVVLTDVSAEQGIDTHAYEAYRAPKVLVEDMYGSANDFLDSLIQKKLPLPDRICVMDKGAKDIMVKKFPELAGRIEITGQPAFDKFAFEETEKIALEVKKKLGLKAEDKLISFMSTMDEPEKIEEMAQALKKVKGDFYLVFRRHPRDNVSYEVYKKILTAVGIKVIDTNEFTTDEIGAASDIVLTTWSTEGLNAIYRRKPCVNIVDPKFKIESRIDFPLVQTKLGASVGVDSMNKLADILPQLLNIGSKLNSSLRRNMEENYPVDGKNAERVADIVRQFIK